MFRVYRVYPMAANQTSERLVPASTKLSEAEHEAVAEHARAEDRTVSYLIRKAVQEWLGRKSEGS